MLSVSWEWSTTWTLCTPSSLMSSVKSCWSFRKDLCSTQTPWLILRMTGKKREVSNGQFSILTKQVTWVEIISRDSSRTDSWATLTKVGSSSHRSNDFWQALWLPMSPVSIRRKDDCSSKSKRKVSRRTCKSLATILWPWMSMKRQRWLLSRFKDYSNSWRRTKITLITT